MLIENKVIKNISWIIICKIIQSIISLVIGMVSARYLGPSNYGLISYASSLVAFIVPVVQLGMKNTLVQELIEYPSKEGEILGTAIGSCLIASILGIIGILNFVLIVNHNEIETIIVCALYSISLVFQMSEMIQYWYQAKLLSKYTSITSLLTYIIVSLYKIYLLVAGKNIYWFAVSNALDYLLISSVLLLVYKKLKGQKFTFSSICFKRLFSKSKYYIVSGMMITVFSQTDRIMIKLLVDEVETGFYSAAITCAGMTSFIFVALIDSLRPVILQSKKKNEQSFENNVIKLYSIIIYLGLIQSVFMCLESNLIINILYGQKYAPAAIILSTVTWYSAFSYLGSARNIWILAEGYQKILWRINLSGAVLNVIGNFVLIPKLGANGAAIASVVTQFFTNFLLCFIIKEIRPNGKMMLKALNPNILFKIIVRIIKEIRL